MTEDLETRLNSTKKRYLNDDQCKKAAARISAEMREDREGRETWGPLWVAWDEVGRGKKPLNLISPGDFEEAKAAIQHLYHEAEAEIIIAALTP
jgi:hypothetical protein